MTSVSWNSFVVTTLSTLPIVLALAVYLNSKKRKKSPLIATPPGYPIIRNLFDMLPANILTTFEKFPEKYGNFYELYAFSKRMLIIADMETVKEILSKRPKHIIRSQGFDHMGEILGVSPYGLFHASDPAIWGRVRKLTVPAFSKLNIQKMTHDITDEAKSFIDRLKKASSSAETLDMKYWAQSYTVRVIGRVSFGSDGADYFYSDIFYEDVVAIFKVSLESALFPLPKFFWKFTHFHWIYERRALEGDRRFNAACQQIIDRKRQAYANKININNHALLDILIRQEESRDLKAISDQEILSNVKTFYLAGSETTSVVISWTMFYLSQNPKLLANIRKEADPFFSQDLAKLSVEDVNVEINKLRLCYLLIKEVTRLRSPATFLVIEPIEEEFELSNGIVIYRGEDCSLMLQNSLVDGNIYRNPTECIPERWLTEDKDELQRMESTYVAFGYGARLCPGMNLSLVEGALAVAAIAHNFNIELACSPEEVYPVFNFTSQPNKMPIRLRPRN